MAVQSQQLLFPLLRVHVHAAEFVHLKPLAVLADTLLGKEDGTGRTDVNGGCHKNHQHTADQTAHQSAGNVHGPLQEGLLGGGIVHAAGEHRVIAHLLHNLDSALHMSDLHQTQMYRHTHFHKIVHQCLDLLCGFRQIHKNLIHPVFLGIGSSLGSFRHHRHTADCGSHETFLQQYQTVEPVSAVIVVTDIFDDLFHIVPVADQQQRAAAHPAGLLQHQFPAQTGRIADDHIESTHQHHGGSGVHLTGLLSKQEQHRKQHDKQRLLQQRLHLPVIAPFQNIPERLCEENNHQITHQQKGIHADIDGILIGIDPAVPQNIGQHEGDLKYHQIQHHEVKVLQPSFGISSVHDIVSSLSPARVFFFP